MDTNDPTIIDADDFERAQRDPKVHAFVREAQESVERLRREGRDHTYCTCPWYHNNGECPVHGNP